MQGNNREERWDLYPSHVGATESARLLGWEVGHLLGERHFSLVGLAREILRRAGSWKPSVHGNERLLFLLPALLREGDIETPRGRTRPILEWWNLAQAVLNLRDELKGHGLDPGEIRAAADRLIPPLSHRLARAADMFAAYEELIAADGFRDPLGEIVDAAAGIERSPPHGLPRQLVLHGFFRFSPVQLRLLDALAARGIIVQIASPPQKIPPEITCTPFPGREPEARGVARSVKALILAGAPPREILVAYREPGRAQEIKRAFSEVGVPIWVDLPLSFQGNPVIDLLDLLLTLAADDFPRPQVVELLRHPACRHLFDPSLWQDLDRRSRSIRLLGGFEGWKTLLEDPAAPAAGDPRWDPLPLLTLIRDTLSPPVSEGDHLNRHGILPVSADQHPAGHLIRRGVELIERLRIPESVRRLGGDLEPWLAVRTMLLRVRRVLGARPCSLEETRELLRILSREALPMREPLHLDRVIAVNAFDAVGLSRPTLFLIGMSEGEFPPRLGWDPIFSGGERLLINKALGTPALATPEIRREEDEACFRSLASSPRRSLHLSYAAAPDEGVPLPSYLIEECLPKEKVIPRRFPTPDSGRLDKHHIVWVSTDRHPSGLFSPRDLLLRVGARRFLLPAEERARLEPLLTANALHTAARGQARELARATGDPAALGAITDPHILADLVVTGSKHAPIAVTRIEEFGRCPFRYFARVVLGLDPLEEPDADVTPLDAGRLAHQVLHQAYASVKENGIPFSRMEAVRSRVRDTAERLLNEEGERYAPIPALRDLFKRRFLLLLDQFVEWDLASLAKDRRTPETFEVDLRERSLEVDGETFFVSGRCDRIDLRNGEPFVVDYKWGSSAQFPAHHLLQVPLYAHLLGGSRTAGGGYFSLTRPDRSSIRRTASWKGRQRTSFEDAVASTLRWTAIYLRAIRRGIFPPYPAADRKLPAATTSPAAAVPPPPVELAWQRSPCDHCRFPSVCRIRSVTETRIPEPLG